MASPATANEPSAEHVKQAVEAIEKLDADLLAEKVAYMNRCKTIRKIKADRYDQASDRGIGKKLLKTKIKERSLHRRIDGLTADLEADERSEYEMISEKLGEFADTPLGGAALARAADGRDAASHAGRVS
jgi:hypothetical protein